MKKISNILFAFGLMTVSLIVGGAQSGCNAKSEGDAASSDGVSAAETGAEAQAVGAETSQSTETPAGDSAVAGCGTKRDRRAQANRMRTCSRC